MEARIRYVSYLKLLFIYISFNPDPTMPEVIRPPPPDLVQQHSPLSTPAASPLHRPSPSPSPPYKTQTGPGRPITLRERRNSTSSVTVSTKIVTSYSGVEKGACVFLCFFLSLSLTGIKCSFTVFVK